MGEPRGDLWPEGWDPEITVVIPAHNEAESIATTVETVLRQTVKPALVIVGNDCSSDDTGRLAREAGAYVLDLPRQGVKGKVINEMLKHVKTPYMIVIDADVRLEPDAIEKLIVALADGETFCASGFIIPWKQETLWEKLRTVQYIVYMSVMKPGQALWCNPIVASGCFLAINTGILRELNGFSGESVAEDMEVTWRALARGYSVKFIPDAICYAFDPPTYVIFKRQVLRWYRGFWQILKQTGLGILDNRGLAIFVGLNLAELAMGLSAWALLFYGAAAMYVSYALALPPINYLPQYTPYATAWLLLQGVLALVLSQYYGRKYGVSRRVLLEGWFYYIATGWLETWFFIKAFALEWIMRRHLAHWDKGHVCAGDSKVAGGTGV